MSISSAQARVGGAAVLAALGWFALLLQLVLQSRTASTLGLSVAEGMIRFFSYFTIEVNILAAFALTAFAAKRGASEGARGIFFQSAIAVYIGTVGLGFSALLRHLRPPDGAPWFADMLLHDFMPLAYVAFWLICMRKSGLRWRDALLWLIYPLIYLAFVLTRGAFSDFYPYSFIDVGRLGYGTVAVNTFGLMIACWALGSLFVAVGRWLVPRQEL